MKRRRPAAYLVEWATNVNELIVLLSLVWLGVALSMTVDAWSAMVDVAWGYFRLGENKTDQQAAAHRADSSRPFRSSVWSVRHGLRRVMTHLRTNDG